MVIYWDASAILSTLFHDSHSDEAVTWAKKNGFHLLSSLTWAEVHAVIARIQRERVISTTLLEAARAMLHEGPWWQLSTVPSQDLVKQLATKWSLRGADLWHLAAAKTLHGELPELFLLTFDQRLKDAAIGEGLGKGSE